MNALSEQNISLCFIIIKKFLLIAIIVIIISFIGFYATNSFSIKVKASILSKFIDLYTKNQDLHFVNFSNIKIDNINQRISSNIQIFISGFFNLFIKLFSNFLLFYLYAKILFTLSRTLSIEVYGKTVNLSGFFFVVAVLYALISTIMFLILGKKQPSFNFELETVQANFRFSLAMIRRNSEDVAITKGQTFFKKKLEINVTEILQVLYKLYKVELVLDFLNLIYDHSKFLLVTAIAIPFYLKGVITLFKI